MSHEEGNGWATAPDPFFQAGLATSDVLEKETASGIFPLKCRLALAVVAKMEEKYGMQPELRRRFFLVFARKGNS